MSVPEKIIEVKNLSKQYGKLKAVDDVSFDVFRGDVFGFLGPNGAGKSTTIRCLLTLITPTSGEISLFGKQLLHHRHDILSRIGSIVEKPDFYPYLSAEKNLEMLARVSGRHVARSKFGEMIEFVGLEGRGRDKVGHFSHGMKQRLGIAQALLHDPELIILDEPTTGLDPQGILDIRNLILQLKGEQNKTIILSSHILSEIELIANRMVILSKGRSAVQGEVSSLMNSQELVVTFSVDCPLETRQLIAEKIPGIVMLPSDEKDVRMQVSHEQVRIINQMLVENGIGVYGIDSRRKLEDYFLKLVNN